MNDFETQIEEKGWARFEGALNEGQLSGLRIALDSVYETQRPLQEKNGVAGGLSGIVHCILGVEKPIDDFLSQMPLQGELRQYFGKSFILNNFGGVINFPGNEVYVNRPHRDVRDFTYPLRLMMNMLVMLDDFTIENGATHVWEGSHKAQVPDEIEKFPDHSIQITGKAGDIVLWNSNLLHAAGKNKTGEIRRALTICFSRPYVKPSIDFLTALDSDFIDAQSENVKSLLGVHARPAADLNAFYQPAENRSYKMD